MPEPTTQSRREVRFVFLAWLVALVLLSAGYNDSIDATGPLLTARSLVETGDFGLRPLYPNTMVLHEGRYGAWYSKMGLLPTVLDVPLVLAASWISRAGLPEARVLDFLLSLLNPLLTAWLLALVYGFFRRTHSKTESLWLTTALGAGTLLLPYSKTCLREPLQALCLVGAYTQSKDRPFRAGLWAAAALLTKHALLIPLLPLFWIRRRQLGELLLPVGFAALAQMLYQWRAWGSPFYPGYGLSVTGFQSDVWKTSVWRGLWIQLFSLEKGLLFTAPLALLFLFSKAAWRSPLARCLFLAAGLQLLLHARWYDPAGQHAFGPRYLIPILPLLWLAAPRGQYALTPVFKGAVALAVLTQLVFSSIKPQQYHTLRERAGEALPLPHPAANFLFFAHKLSGLKEGYDLGKFGGSPGRVVDLSDARSLVGFNYAALHLRQARLQDFSAARPKTDAVTDVQKRREAPNAERSERTELPRLPRSQGAE